MNQTILKNMIAEWLEEFALPTFIPRDAALYAHVIKDQGETGL